MPLTRAPADLNPQPLPPKVSLGQLTEAVTASVRNALEQQAVSAGTGQVFRNARISIGVLVEPRALAE